MLLRAEEPPLAPLRALTQITCDVKALLGDTGHEAQQLRPRESAKGERTRRNVPWGRVLQQGRVGGESAGLCGQGAPGRPGCGAGGGQKEHRAFRGGCFFLAGSSQCSTMCTREECHCKDRGSGISAAQSQARPRPQARQSEPSLPVPTGHQTGTICRVQLKRERKCTDKHENVLRLFLREHLSSVLLAKILLGRNPDQAEFFLLLNKVPQK